MDHPFVSQPSSVSQSFSFSPFVKRSLATIFRIRNNGVFMGTALDAVPVVYATCSAVPLTDQQGWEPCDSDRAALSLAVAPVSSASRTSSLR